MDRAVSITRNVFVKSHRTTRQSGARKFSETHQSQEDEAGIGCGVDVVELSRFRAALGRGGKAFVKRVFTPQETAYAKERKRTSLLHLAARFAAKEAVIKALSQIAPQQVLAMRQIEIHNDAFGRPHVKLHHRLGLEVKALVSLSHTPLIAVASAIAFRRDCASQNGFLEGNPP